MQFRCVETPGLAHYAYVIGDQGVGAVVDPRRDVDVYLEAARALGLRIELVLETHRHEDFVSGAATLAERTGARIVTGNHPGFGRADLRLADSERMALGRLRLQARHTPGHTPESTTYVIELDDEPFAALTGDTLLFGDSGRTDLVADADVRVQAGRLFDSVHAKLGPLPDDTRVLPAHGPGSVCGSGLASRPWSTLGRERRSNPVFTLDRIGFVARRAGDRLPRPLYFQAMEQLNSVGGAALRRGPGEVPLIEPETFAAAVLVDAAVERAGLDAAPVVIDTREPESFGAGHIPGAYSIWAGGLAPFAGWIAGPDTPIYLCNDDHDDVDEAVARLARIGLDQVRGALRGGFARWRARGLPVAGTGVIRADQLALRLDEVTVVDVRDPHEYARGSVDGPLDGAIYAPVGSLVSDPELRAAVPRDRPLAVVCDVGHRASLAASALARAGYADVSTLLGGVRAWAQRGRSQSSNARTSLGLSTR